MGKTFGCEEKKKEDPDIINLRANRSNTPTILASS